MVTKSGKSLNFSKVLEQSLVSSWSKICPKLLYCLWIFKGPKGVVLSTQRIQNLPKIALSVTVFEINDIFPFTPKFKMVAKIRESKNFSEVLEL